MIKKIRKSRHLKIYITTLLVFNSLIFGQNIDEIKNKIHTIYSLGKRDIYSEGKEKTRDFIKKELKKYGYNVQEYEFFISIDKKKIKGVNIFGYTSKEKDFIIIASHYDSKYFKDFDFFGANDNISGVVATLEIARILKEEKRRIEVGFLFIDLEEAIFKWSSYDGLYGSKEQVRLWEKERFLNKIKYFILLDMIGDENTVFCKETNSDKELNDKIWEIANNMGYYFFSSCNSTVEDDHIPFRKKGIKAIDIIAYPFPDYWHTKDDTIDKLSPEFIYKVVNVIKNFILKF